MEKNQDDFLFSINLRRIMDHKKLTGEKKDK